MRHKDVQETEIVHRGEEDGMSDGIAATSGRGTTSLGDSRVETRQRRGRKCLVRQREGRDETGLWRRCAAAGVLRATPDRSPSIFGACHVHCYLSIWLDGISREKLYRFLHLPALLTFCWCEQREWTFCHHHGRPRARSEQLHNTLQLGHRISISDDSIPARVHDCSSARTADARVPFYLRANIAPCSHSYPKQGLNLSTPRHTGHLEIGWKATVAWQT